MLISACSTPRYSAARQGPLGHLDQLAMSGKYIVKLGKIASEFQGPISTSNLPFNCLPFLVHYFN